MLLDFCFKFLNLFEYIFRRRFSELLVTLYVRQYLQPIDVQNNRKPFLIGG